MRRRPTSPSFQTRRTHSISIQDHLLTAYLADARRYFKQSEIVLYRLAPEFAATPQIAQQQQAQQQLQQQQLQQHQYLPGAATPGPGRDVDHQQQHSAPAPTA